MKIIITGPAGSGKTTLLHKIIRSNPNITFQLILDGYETIQGSVNNVIPNLPNEINYIITTTQLQNIPENIRVNTLILDVQLIRGLNQG